MACDMRGGGKLFCKKVFLPISLPHLSKSTGNGINLDQSIHCRGLRPRRPVCVLGRRRRRPLPSMMLTKSIHSFKVFEDPAPPRSFATSPCAVILERSEESRRAIPLEDDNCGACGCGQRPRKNTGVGSAHETLQNKTAAEYHAIPRR